MGKINKFPLPYCIFCTITNLVGVIAFIYSLNELQTNFEVQFTLYAVKHFTKPLILIHASHKLAFHYS